MMAATPVRQIGPALTFVGLGVLAAGIAWMLVAPIVREVPDTLGYDIDRMVLYYSTLPRMVTALVCGGARQ